MKKTTKKKLRIVLILLVFIILFFSLLSLFGSLEYAGTNRAKSTFGDRFIQDGNASGLTFDIDRGTISGIKMQFFRNFIISDENNRYLEIRTTYYDENGHEQILSRWFKLSKIKGRRYNYMDIEDIKIDKPTKITFFFQLDRPLEGEDYFQIGYDDSDPDSLIDRSPRIIYKTDLCAFLIGVNNSINQDHWFFVCYFALVALVVFSILIIIISNKKTDN